MMLEACDVGNGMACSDNRRRLRQWLLFGVVVGWLWVIYEFSADTAAESSDLSNGIVHLVVLVCETLLRRLFGSSIVLDQDVFSFIIRKGAHCFLYFVLGLFVYGALTEGRKRHVIDRWVFVALCFCICVALTDELHQLFVNGRSGEWSDVMVDSFGAVLGVSLQKHFSKSQTYGIMNMLIAT